MAVLLNAILAAMVYGGIGIAYALVVLAAVGIVAAVAGRISHARAGIHHQPRAHVRHGYQAR